MDRVASGLLAGYVDRTDARYLYVGADLTDETAPTARAGSGLIVYERGLCGVWDP